MNGFPITKQHNPTSECNFSSLDPVSQLALEWLPQRGRPLLGESDEKLWAPLAEPRGMRERTHRRSGFTANAVRMIEHTVSATLTLKDDECTTLAERFADDLVGAA